MSHAPRSTLATCLAGLLCIAFGCERNGQPPPASPTVAGTRETPPSAPAAAPLRRPPPLPPPLNEAIQLIGRRRFAEARDVAHRYAEANPDDGRGAFMIGLTYQKAGNHGASVAYFERALEASPDYYVTHRFFGESLFMLGDMDGARREYEALRAAEPNEPDAQYGLGLVELEHGRLAEAERRFRRGIELFDSMRRSNPRQFRLRQSDLAECHARLADVHFARDEYESARDALLASTTIYPRNISAFYALSLVHRRLGEDELADRALERYETAREAIIKRGASGG